VLKNDVCGIYCIKNKINKKRYIGESIHIKKRFYAHRSNLRTNAKGKESEHLLRAWNKYGEENFEFYVILKLPAIQIILDIFEIFFIFIFQSHLEEKGYNKTRGGKKIAKRLHHTEESKIKMRKPRLPFSLEHRQRIGEAQIGKAHHVVPHTPEQRKRISDGKKNPSEETRLKNSNAALGVKRIKNSSSRYVGVSYDKKNKKWAASIQWNGKRLHLGRFNTELEAALAYNAKALELYGSRAKLNIIEE
jgi:group I intron endonuclease